jgi:enoyl-CoA hydratase/carnithine racemase
MTDNPGQASDDLVALSIDGPVATLTLNRPSKLNALTPDTFARMRAYLELLSSDPDISCLVLHGAGRCFCAGHDLDAIASGHEERHRLYEAETIDLLEAFAHPTIAKIHGYCLTGGLELALACDILICSADTKFGDTHGKWGLAPAWGMSARLPERVGLAVAKELSFTSRVIDGTTAMRIGLVNRSVPGDRLDSEVGELVQEIADNSAEANRIFKSLYRNYLGTHRQEHLELERRHPFGVPSDGPDRIRKGARSL